MATSAVAAVSVPQLAVVVFSKDRPCQLLSCLASLLRHVRGAKLDVYVLHKASSQLFSDSYRLLAALFALKESSSAGPDAGDTAGYQVHWLEETAQEPLGELLDTVVRCAEASHTAELLFTVDDALFFGDFDAAAAAALLRGDASVFAVHAKLCPRMEYAHPNDKFMRLPRFEALTPAGAGVSTGSRPCQEPELLLFQLGQGEYDWNYPWELSASIYRLDDVREMLGAIREHFGEAGVDHPNRLEGYGVRLFKQEKVGAAKRCKRCACASRPVMGVVTINRVQDLFGNPVYGEAGDMEASASPEASPEALDAELRREVLHTARRLARGSDGAASAAEAMAERTSLPAEWLAEYWSTVGDVGEEDPCSGGALGIAAYPPEPIFPMNPYRAAYLDSVHVPLLSPPSPSATAVAQRAPEGAPLVTWLVPVHNTPAEWLGDCLRSIQQQRGLEPGRWELVAVDDASEAPGTLEVLETWRARPEVRVLRLERRRGVGGALNFGWAACKGEFVARLDADDMAHEDRLAAQLAFLQAHPSVSLVGGGFRTFRETSELLTEEGLAATRRYRMPCHPLLARWRMLFGCTLAHPTVTFRRADFAAEPGPYPEDEEAEDHCLWLRLPLSLQLANVADVVGFLRRHPGSRSASAAQAIKRSSFGAVRRFLSEHCTRSNAAGGSGTPEDQLLDHDLEVLWGSAQASSAEQAARVSRALDDFEAFFLRLADAERSEELTAAFHEDFVRGRSAALREYVRSSGNKLRGLLTVQSLAAGDLSSGTEMMRHWLKGGDGGLKSLGALIGAGFAP